MRQLLALLVALLAAVPADAQFRRDKRFAQRGDVALVASVQGLANLRIDPALGGVGLRYRAADQTVLGASLGFGRFENETDESANPTDDTERTDGSASVWLEQHLGRGRLVSPFVGAGVRFRMVEYESSRSQSRLPCGDPTACDPVVQTFESSYEEDAVSGALFVGAEVRIVRGVTVGGAYAVGAEVYRRDRLDIRAFGDTAERTESNDEGLRAGTTLSSFFLSVYF